MAPIRRGDGTGIGSMRLGDGTEVSEVRTGDGQTVFSAGPNLPVAYSNLVAWYPFDSATYGGSNADDVTALFNPAQSGDSTAYNGTVNGVTYQASGGVTDIIAGPNSGAFEFDGQSNVLIDTFTNPSGGTGNYSNFTITVWANPNQTGERVRILSSYKGSNRLGNGDWIIGQETDGWEWTGKRTSGQQISDNWGTEVASSTFLSVVGSGSDVRLYENGTLKKTVTYSDTATFSNAITIGEDRAGDRAGENFDGTIDDVRFYNTDLSSLQIDQIYQNTEP